MPYAPPFRMPSGYPQSPNPNQGFDLSSILGLENQPMPTGAPQDTQGSVLDNVLATERRKREEKAQKLFAQGQRHMLEASQLQAPKPQPAIGGLKDLLLPLIIGLGAKLAGAKDRDLAEGAAGFMQGRQGVASQNNAYAQQAFEAQQRALQTQGQLDLNASQFEQAAADRTESDRRYNQNRTDALAREAGNDRDRIIAAAEEKYYRANTPSEKRIAAAKWRALAPEFAPGNDQVEADIRDMNVKNVQSASSALGTEINRVLQGVGFIDDQNGAALEARAQAIAKEWGIDRAQLPIVPSGDTLRKQAFENHKAEFDKTFTFRAKEANIRDAQGWARIDALKQQLEIARQNLGMRGASLALAERRFQFEIQKTAGGLLSSHTKELTKARTDLAREESVLDQMRARGVKVGLGAGIDTPGSPEAQQAEKVQHLRDEVKAWEDMAKAAQEEYQDASGAAPQGAPPAPEANVTPGQGGNVPVQIGGLPSGPIGKPPKSQNSQKSHQPKSKPKASAPKGETVYNQGGVTVRKRS